eukprot:61402-Pyramimonas_sp.AAC.1
MGIACAGTRASLHLRPTVSQPWPSKLLGGVQGDCIIAVLMAPSQRISFDSWRPNIVARTLGDNPRA